MAKNMLMSEAFVTNVYYLVHSLDAYELDPYIMEVCSVLKQQIDRKLAAMDLRSSFSKYKSAEPCSAERELHRREYVDKAGFHRNWCSENEAPL